MTLKKTKIGIIVTTILGCGLCCLPLLGPLLAGTALASIWALHSDEIICAGILVGMLIVGGYVFIIKRRKDSCDLPN